MAFLVKGEENPGGYIVVVQNISSWVHLHVCTFPNEDNYPPAELYQGKRKVAH